MQSIISEPKIHFYEFMQIEILHQYILTGIEYMVRSILNSNERFISYRYYSQQIAAFISGLKDLYFLVKHKGLYAENFYGLQRVNKRNKFVILIQVFMWIILPYLLKKMQNKFYSIKQKQDAQIPLKFVQKIYSKVFPIIYCITKITSTILKFRYLITPDSKYYNIEYCATKTQLGYIDREQPSPFPIMTLLKSPGLFLILISHKIFTSIFSFDKKKKSKEQVKEIRAPLQQKKIKQCPICGNNFKNPAVLLSSGYVFCYNCINQQIKSERKCPVTQIQSKQDQIQIIYQ